MFLDDQLLEIGRSVDFEDADSIFKTTEKMIKACYDNLIEKVKDCREEKVIIAQVKRVIKTWELVADKLESEQISLIKREGFALLIKKRMPEIYKAIYKN